MDNLAHFPNKTKPAAPGLRSSRVPLADRIDRFCEAHPVIEMGSVIAIIAVCGYGLLWILLAVLA